MQQGIFTKLFIIVFIAGFYRAQGQTNLPYNQVKQNNNWMFGIKSGLSFNSGNAVPITSQCTYWQGYSSISDNTGQLLMYANMDTVWDHNGNKMPNGKGLLPFLPATPASPGTMHSQGSLIVPFVKDKNKYFVFSQTSYWGSTAFQSPGNDPQAGRLYYSVVDMSLNGGLGDVVSGQKGIQLDSALCDRMVAVKGSNCNAWLLTMASGGTAIHAFEITSSGINPVPVISPCVVALSATLNISGMFKSSSAGQLLASPDNQKLAVSVAGQVNAGGTWYGGGFQLYDFNNATGVVSNQKNVVPVSTVIGLDQMTFSLCFSPDNTKLYTAVGALSGGALAQYDITGSNAAAIQATKVVLSSACGWASGMRLGPDDKIYISSTSQGSFSAILAGWGSTLHRIEFPNLAGTAATFTPNAIPLPPGTKVGAGLGNATVDRPPSDSANTSHQLALCSYESSVELTVLQDAGYTYQWNDGQTVNSRPVTQPGTYWVSYGNRCFKYTDTFVVESVNVDPGLGADTVICGYLSPFELDAQNVPGATYVWQDGSGLSHFKATDTGTYYVTVSKMGCTASDTIRIDNYDVFQHMDIDTSVCEGISFNIYAEARVPDGAAALWNTGQTTAGIHITTPGIYVVTVSQDICTAKGFVTVKKELCDCITFMPTAFSPNGDGLNDVFMPQTQSGCAVNGYNFNIYNRYGQKIFSSQKIGAGWDGTFYGVPVEPGTYMFTLSYEKGTKHNPYQLKGDVALVR